jgi:hypothetical protein
MNMKNSRSKCLYSLGISGMAGFGLATDAFAEQPQVKQKGSVVTITAPATGSQANNGINYKDAKPMPLPTLHTPPPSALDTLLTNPAPSSLFRQPGYSPGKAGDGKQSPVQLVPSIQLNEPASNLDGVTPQEYGTSNQVYTTSEVNAYGDSTVRYYPYRAAGKLFFKIGGATYVCSASLIKTGIVVTAAHCVANFGQKQYYSNWQYVPAYDGGTAPYGTWNAASVMVLTSYYNGTDPCASGATGVVCQDDVAVLTLAPQSGKYAGASTGYLGYGWNGYGFNPSNQALISQLGYPVALDSGSLMERTDSQGYVAPTLANNTVIGSLMTGGSSGGPWTVNLGIPPSLSGTSFGNAAAHNTVVGVTSWGYTSDAIKQEGASPFLSTNIVTLVNTACTATPAACQ